MISRKSISLVIVFFLCLSVMGVFPECLQAEEDNEHSYFYREKTGQLISEYRLSYQQQGRFKRIASYQEQKFFQALCQENGATVYWSFESQCGDKVTARIVDDQVHIFGKVGEKIIESTFSLDGDPWYQPLSYSLRKMLDESTGDIRFWTIRPDTFTPVLLKAEKFECSKVVVDDEDIDACRVEISKSGLLGNFWSASYWFRQSDGLFVQYRGTHGLPGTDETVIQLILDKDQKQVAVAVPPVR